MPVVPITCAEDERLSDYLRLTERQLRSVADPLNARIICESRLVLETALELGLTPLSLFLDERHLPSMEGLLAEIPPEVPIYVAPSSLMSQVTGFTVTRGYLGCFKRPVPPAVEDVLRGARRVAVLEGIVDVTNVGAIFRSAAALGVDGVLLAPSCADPLSRRAMRVSMGCVLKLPWARLGKPWPEGAFDLLHQEGFCCAALALEEGALRLDDPALASEERLALFFGTEGDGLSRRAIAGADRVVTIPMSHGVDSLNVAAASAVTFWQLCRP
jgi:tRNA G18 (ribose-2'-O)-methylase SpoU